MKWGIVAFLALLASSAVAQDRIDVPLDGGVRLRLKQPARTLVIPDEGILRVEPVEGSDITFRLLGEGPGTTTLSAQNAEGAVFYTAIVTVGPPARTITIISSGRSGRQSKAGSTLDLHDEYTYRCTATACERQKESKRDKRIDRWFGVEAEQPRQPQSRPSPDDAAD